MNDRKQALVFIVSVLAISWGFEAIIIVNGGAGNFGPLWIVALMCIPGALSIVLRLILKSGLGDVGFRIGKGRYYLYAVAVPLLLALLVGLISAALDIRNFSPVSLEQLIQLGPVLITVLGLGLIGAFGEELGWRGFCCPDDQWRLQESISCQRTGVGILASSALPVQSGLPPSSTLPTTSSFSSRFRHCF